MKDAQRKKDLENPRFDRLSASLKHSYEHADYVMKSRATSFYQAFQHLDFEKFRDITAIYAFCRYVDDIADGELADSKEDALAKLDQVENEIRRLYAAQVRKPDYAAQVRKPDYAARVRKPDTVEVMNAVMLENLGKESESDAPRYEWWEAFANAAVQERVPLRALLLQLEGQRSDIAFQDIETVDDLIVYCLQVAGSVGIMLSPMIRNQDSFDGKSEQERADSGSDEHYHRVCESLGIAMQVTNILRDIGEDLRKRGRVYVPKSLMEAHGVTRKDLEQLAQYEASAQTSEPLKNENTFKTADRMSELEHKLVVRENIKALWEEMAQISERYYAIFFENIGLFSAESRVSVAASAVLYRAILDAVREQQYDCFTHRCYVNEEKKQRLISELKKRL